MANLIQQQQEKIQNEIAKINDIIDQYEQKIEPELNNSEESIIAEKSDTKGFSAQLREIIAETGIFDKLGVDKEKYINVSFDSDFTEVSINIYQDSDSYHDLITSFDVWERNFDKKDNPFEPTYKFDRVKITDVDITNQRTYSQPENKEKRLKAINERMIDLEVIKYFADLEFKAFTGKGHQLGNEFIESLRNVKTEVEAATEAIKRTEEKYQKFYERKDELKEEYDKVLDQAIIQAIYAQGGIKFNPTQVTKPKEDQFYDRLKVKPSGDYWANKVHLTEIRLGKETDKTLTIEFLGSSTTGNIDPKDAQVIETYRQPIPEMIQTLTNWWKKYTVRKTNDPLESSEPLVKSPRLPDFESTKAHYNKWYSLEEGEYDRSYY